MVEGKSQIPPTEKWQPAQGLEIASCLPQPSAPPHHTKCREQREGRGTSTERWAFNSTVDMLFPLGSANGYSPPQRWGRDTPVRSLFYFFLSRTFLFHFHILVPVPSLSACFVAKQLLTSEAPPARSEPQGCCQPAKYIKNCSV